MTKKTLILIAVGALYGGTYDKNKNLVAAELADGEELTPEKAEALGLNDKAIEELISRGKLVALDVRQAEGGTDNSAELAAAVARADKAEADVKTLTGKVAELEKQIEAAKKAPTPASAGQARV